MINTNGMGGVFMQLPKNITQIGETNPHCKVYVEDYVISYIKQLNRYACDKGIAVALYGIHKEEAGITYIFLYGACKLNFLQKECRHLSQAVMQEAEKQRKRYFSEYIFLGYRLLNGEMVEGFHICEQGVCRYIEGYAQFYEKNDSMLAYMVDERQGAVQPEEFNQEKYDVVKKRQEERRASAGERGGHAYRSSGSAGIPPKEHMAVPGAVRLRRMKYSAAAVFALLCVTGLAAMGNGGKLGDLQTTAGRFLDDLTRRQLPDDGENPGLSGDSLPVSNGSVQVGTIVAEDKLNDAILKENENAGNAARQSPTPEESNQPTTQPTSQPTTQSTPQPTVQPTPQPTAQSTPQPTVQPTAQPTPQPTAQPTPDPTLAPTAAPTEQPAPKPVSYTVKRGDTLIGICIKKYGSDARVAEVCSLNNITNPDKIKIGQKILLP